MQGGDSERGRLRLVPIALEQKAPIPRVEMKVIREEEHGHGHNTEEDVDEVDMGQPLKLEWKLVPETGEEKERREWQMPTASM